MVPFLRKQWFLITLSAVMALGMCRPSWFEAYANAKQFRNFIVASVLFIMALPLDTKSITDSIRRPWPALFASLMNVGVLPLTAWLFVQVLQDQDMRRGLLVTAAVPCTLASAAVWTRRAGGDDTVAILVTTVTNLTCFLTIPFWLYVTIGSQLSPEDQARLMQMPLRLGLLVVLPMGLAQLLRQIPRVGSWATKQRARLSLLAQAGILAMVLAGSTICGLNLADRDLVSLSAVPIMAVVAVLLHLTVFYLGFVAARGLGFTRGQQIATGMAGSQKTLMIGLDIAITYVGGLAILPMVVYHLGQLIADTLIADWLRSGNKA